MRPGEMNDDRDSRSCSSRHQGSDKAPAWRKKEFQKPVNDELEKSQPKQAREPNRVDKEKRRRKSSSSSSPSSSSGMCCNCCVISVVVFLHLKIIFD